jgi:hypothetical protein
VVPILTWDKSPNAVIFRVDRSRLKEPPLAALNHIPLCTMYGNGHVVWVNPIPPNGDEVLEAYIDDATFRAFLEFAIRDMKFYDIPDYAARELPPAEDAPMESITLNLSTELRTARNYGMWQNNVFAILSERCLKLSAAPARYEPTAGWVTVFAADAGAQGPSVLWPSTAPFKMADALAGNRAIWVEGVAIKQLWNVQRETQGTVRWLEGETVYQVALQIPLISRDSPPAPSQ